MSNRLARSRAQLSFANVTSLLALFVALGGTSYAAVSIGSKEIRAGAVGKSEIRTGAVGKSEAATNSIGALELRRNSVGNGELADNAVGSAELANDAVTTSELKNGGVELDDLSAAARTALTATDRAAVTPTAKAVGGNAKTVTNAGNGVYTVEFAHDVSGCTYSATLATVKDGTAVEEAPVGFATVAPGERNTNVVVKTYKQETAAVTAADAPFHLVVAC